MKKISDEMLVVFPSSQHLPPCCVCISSRQLGSIHKRPEQNRKIPEDKEEKYQQLQPGEKNTHLQTQSEHI